jgi:predicted transcriptional regulator
MLEYLFGNKTIERILLFLFVNGKCYPTQLSKTLKMALTPIQHALARLEDGGIVVSFYEGKTRVYQLNPAYPVADELGHLLKRAYTHLEPEQQKEYFFKPEVKEKATSERQVKQWLETLWRRLETIRGMTVQVRSGIHPMHDRVGRGEVQVVREGEQALLFHERGSWKTEQGGEIDFKNCYRWSRQNDSHLISLEHLRHGLHKPVFLMHLFPVDRHCFESVNSHLCDGDTYMGRIICNRQAMKLNWRIIGKAKNEEMETHYT